MPIGYLFWTLFILAIIFSSWGFWPGAGPLNRPMIGGSLLVIVLIALLGWRVFGSALQ